MISNIPKVQSIDEYFKFDVENKKSLFVYEMFHVCKQYNVCTCTHSIENMI